MSLRGCAFPLLALPLLGCVTSHDVDVDGPTTAATGTEPMLSAQCQQEIAGSTDGLPVHLQCTGLYLSLADKQVASDVHAYTPGATLWSDGADKRRWIHLPKDTKIDVSTHVDWSFPVGTKLFKEFSVGGRRIETRLFQKVRSDHWVRTTYAWNADESDAKRSPGGDIMVDGNPYHVPTARECDQCHEGRTDRILGFEEIGMGLPDADGLTLAKLFQQKLLSAPPVRANVQISDDGTGMAAPVLGWLHMNCGVGCHNGNPDATGHQTGLNLRLDPVLLASGSVSDYAPIQTTIGVDATTTRWVGQKRIVPGSPDESLLYKLVGSRAGKNDQMPPVATRVVDDEHLQAIAAWIRSMPAQ